MSRSTRPTPTPRTTRCRTRRPTRTKLSLPSGKQGNKKGRPETGGPFFRIGQSDTLPAMRRIFVLAALILCACREQGPPAPTPQQANQLNEAEDLLNQAATNEKGPADRST